jgi:hypothetical protein
MLCTGGTSRPSARVPVAPFLFWTAATTGASSCRSGAKRRTATARCSLDRLKVCCLILALRLTLKRAESNLLDNMRAYNNSFAFTSLGVKQDKTVWGRGGPKAFKIEGQLCHRIGSLLPSPRFGPQFISLHVMQQENPSAALDRRLAMAQQHHVHRLQATILGRLQMLIAAHNPFHSAYKYAAEILAANPDAEITFQLRPVDAADPVRDPRLYNMPTASEVAVLIPDYDVDNALGREIVVRSKDGALRRVSPMRAEYLPLRYPLLALRGSAGFELHARQHRADRGGGAQGAGNRNERVQHVSLFEWAAYQTHFRAGYPSTVHLAQDLMQEWVVDLFACVDQNWLHWIRNNQKELRADQYDNLRNTLAAGGQLQEAGRPHVVLPSSHVGCDRWYLQQYHDAMAIVRSRGPKVDLFITMTCNPGWPEIKAELLPGQTASDRPDLVARVYSLRWKQMLADILELQLFGPVAGFSTTREYQKRTLPHNHLLVVLQTHLDTPQQVDAAISAQLPDPDDESQCQRDLFQLISDHCVHGPCGPENPNAPCMDRVSNKCNKGFPKAWSEATTIETTGYPAYARPNNGRTGRKWIRGKNGNPGWWWTFDNRWIVPHSPVLLLRHGSHINVECAASIGASVKYIFKYTMKGATRQAVSLSADADSVDETQVYLDGRVIGPAEGTSAGTSGSTARLNARYTAVSRLIRDKVVQMGPSVVRLPLHLLHQQQVMFNPDDRANTAAHMGDPRTHKTMLTGFFDLCAADSHARRLLYVDVPETYVWRGDKWTLRKKYDNPLGVCARIQYAMPGSGERFYLRLLLLNVPGPRSYDHLRLVQGVQHPTFKSACAALGLLQSDREWDTALKEAYAFPGRQMRQLLVTILLECDPADPAKLWLGNRVELASDCARSMQKAGLPNPSAEQIFSFALLDIQRLLALRNSTLHKVGLPQPSVDVSAWFSQIHDDTLLGQEKAYDPDQLQRVIDSTTLTGEQTAVCQALCEDVDQKKGGVHVLECRAGSGKTVLINYVMAKLRLARKVVIAVASTGKSAFTHELSHSPAGLAALLLAGGSTAHSRGKIPLHLDRFSECGIKRGTQLGQLWIEADLLIFDEAFQCHADLFATLDRSLRKLRQCDRLFGGLTVLIAGDRHQTLPIIKRGTPTQIMSASIVHTEWFRGAAHHELTLNLRLMHRTFATQDARDAAAAFDSWLWKMAKGDLPKVQGDFTPLPQGVRLAQNTRAQLIDTTFGDLNQVSDLMSKADYLAKRAILAPKNVDVQDLNDIVLQKLEGEERLYASNDSCPDDPSFRAYPLELLNQIDLPLMPPHQLKLKKFAVVFVLRNINPQGGLVNGARLMVTNMGSAILHGVLLNGSHKGQYASIPRIPVSTRQDDTIGINFVRRQFPVRLAWAMTINKSQGQSLEYVGINFAKSWAFAHGQAYVAFSRAYDNTKVKVLLPDDDLGKQNVFANVVYKEIL